MNAVEWPSHMGWTVGPYDVEKVSCCGSVMLRVKSLNRIALVRTTEDPVKAVELTQRYGLPRQELYLLDEAAIDRLLRSHIL